MKTLTNTYVVRKADMIKILNKNTDPLSESVKFVEKHLYLRCVI